MTPYAALEVVETYSRRDGRRWWVRDDEESHLFNLVEYVDRRLVCYCPDGEAHAESPGTDPECAHLRAAIEQHLGAHDRRPPAPISISGWVD